MFKTAKSKLFLVSLVSILMLSFALTGCGGGSQAKFPTKAVTMIIPWPAGGASDLAARLLAKHAEAALGQGIIPENREGSNGAIGWDELKRAKPDGYTVGLVTFDILTNQALGQSTVKYDDLDYLLQFTAQPLGIIVRGDSPYKTLDDLINAAKEKSGELKMGTTPLGGVYHQALALFENEAGVKFNVVPFKGSPDINAAALGGHLDAQVNTLTLADQYFKDGTLRLLAVFSEKRLERYSDVPTMKEMGYDIVYESFRGIGIPKGVPEDVKKILTDAFVKAYESKEFQDAAVKAKFDPAFRTGEEFKKFMDETYPKVESILKQTGFVK